MWEVEKKRQKSSVLKCLPRSASHSRSWLPQACWPCAGKLVTWHSSYQTSPAWVHASDFCLCFYYTNATNSVFARLNWRLSCLKSKEGCLFFPSAPARDPGPVSSTPRSTYGSLEQIWRRFMFIQVLMPAGLLNQRWSYKPKKFTARV